MRVGKWGILHNWALGKLNSMGSWCTELSEYMGGWGRRKLNSIGGWVKKKCLLPPPPPPPPPGIALMKIILLLNSVSRFCTFTISNTHKLHSPWLDVLYTSLNGYSTLLHNIAQGKYIAIKVEFVLQLHSKIFLNKLDTKTTTNTIIQMLMISDFKILSLWFVTEYWWYNTHTSDIVDY